MRICFVSRRFFPAISGMSVYALNLLRELVAAGHDGAVLIGCDSFRAEVVARLGTDPARFTIVPGAVDTDRFTPGAPPPDDPPVMLYHGRVDARKGVLDLLEAARMLQASGDRFR